MELRRFETAPTWSSAAMRVPDPWDGEPACAPVLHVRASVRESLVTQVWIVDQSKLSAVEPLSTGAGTLGIQRAVDTLGAQDIDLYLSKTMLDDYADHHSLPRLRSTPGYRACSCPVMMELARLAMCFYESPSLFPVTFREHFQQLLCGQLIHASVAGSAAPAEARGGLTAFQRRIATEYLAENRLGSIKLRELAEACRLSASHFGRSFKISFGQSVHAWLLRQRVERAKRLLLDSEEQLIEVAFLAGFSDQTTFNRTFRRIEGISPGRWKRIHKR